MAGYGTLKGNKYPILVIIDVHGNLVKLFLSAGIMGRPGKVVKLIHLNIAYNTRRN
jgi:hypothetical protein